MDAQKITVNTPLGKLCAIVGGEPNNYPEIFIYIERDDGVEIDLVAAAVDIDDNCAKAYLYGDTRTEEYTNQHIWSKEEINIPE